MTIRHVVNEERTGFKLEPRTIYGLVGLTAGSSTIWQFDNMAPLSVQSIYRGFAVQT